MPFHLLPAAGAAVALLLASGEVTAGSAPLRAGERLYRDGLGADGAPVRATVLGDVETRGGQVSCAACHGRSGLGSVEGNEITPPITTRALAAPRSGVRPRPAYDPASLVRAVREGVDAAGNPLGPLMPRYALGEADAAALAEYLAHLSEHPSPGVDQETLHLATIVAPDAAPAVRDETVAVARGYVAAQNAAARDLRVRHRRDLRAASGRPVFYGDWALDVWELHGPPAGWAEQLEARYRERPVFAVVSGAGGSTWGPVHAFCEEQGLPCLLPNVETPPAAAGWYSLYFSRGAALEADVIAAHLARRTGPQRVLQVFRPGAAGAEAARALARALEAGGRDRSVELPLDAAGPGAARRVADAALGGRASAIVLWLGKPDLEALGAHPRLPVRTYLSSTLLGGDLAPARAVRAPEGWIVHPLALPTEAAERTRPSQLWLARQGLGPSDGERDRIRDQTLFALEVLSQGLMHLTRERAFQRDFLLEVLDHASGLQGFSVYHPHLSFGPGQRHLSKGCYLVPLGGPERAAEWLVP